MEVKPTIIESTDEPPGLKCNIDVWGFGECQNPGAWRHPMQPQGIYCNEHKKLCEQYMPDGWWAYH